MYKIHTVAMVYISVLVVKWCGGCTCEEKDRKKKREEKPLAKVVKEYCDKRVAALCDRFCSETITREINYSYI